MESVKTIRIFVVAIAANLSTLAAGMCIGWTSPVELKLKSLNGFDSPLSHPINASQEAWISSIMAIGALIAPFVAGPLADKIGRKWVLLSSSAFFAFAFILMLIAHEIWIILLGRFIQGFGVGFVFTVQPMYVGEIAADNVRGATGSLFQLFLASGILYVYAIGPYVSYRVLQCFCLAVPIIFDVFFFFMPESPYYYAGKGQKSNAIESLKFLRGQSENAVQDEMAKIEASVEEANANKGTIADIITLPGNRKALLISAGLVAFQQVSGIDVVLFNSQTIFESTNTSMDSAISAIIIGLIQVGSSVITPFVVDRLGRKIILLISAGFMSLGLAALGTFFYMQLVVGDASKVAWLPLPSLIIFIIAFCAGFGSIPWTILGEMFATNVKSTAASLCASICWILVFFVTYSFPLLETIGSYYVFWMYSAFCALAFFFTLFAVMETKGLSLQEIQNRLNGKKT